MKKILTTVSFLITSLTVFSVENQNKISSGFNTERVIVGTHQAKGTTTFVSADFENGFPPTGWTIQQQNPTTTWQAQTLGPLTGLTSAQVRFSLVDQDEWLISPAFFAASGTVDVNHQGSIFWCRDNNDNCNLDVMLVVDGVGGGDDVLLKRLDEDWPGNFTLTATQIDFTSAIPGPTSSLQIAFRYTGNDGAQVTIDDIVVSGNEVVTIIAPPTPVPSLQWYAMIALAMLLLLVGYRRNRA